MTFRFAPGSFFGNTFRFDLDTDGGPGVSGGHMDGLTVTIEDIAGQITAGILRRDPANEEAAEFGY